MMGMRIAGPAQMFVDNNSVVMSVSTPESRFEKEASVDLLPCCEGSHCSWHHPGVLDCTD